MNFKPIQDPLTEREIYNFHMLFLEKYELMAYEERKIIFDFLTKIAKPLTAAGAGAFPSPPTEPFSAPAVPQSPPFVPPPSPPTIRASDFEDGDAESKDDVMIYPPIL